MRARFIGSTYTCWSLTLARAASAKIRSRSSPCVTACGEKTNPFWARLRHAMATTADSR